ncbi:hypothetical protein BH18ACI1_BH18ACI1_22270 [soil metagenome]
MKIHLIKEKATSEQMNEMLESLEGYVNQKFNGRCK